MIDFNVTFAQISHSNEGKAAGMAPENFGGGYGVFYHQWDVVFAYTK